MTGPKVTGEYSYEEGDLHITTDTGSSFDIQGESADRMAEHIDAAEGQGEFTVAEHDWDAFARGSFR